MLLVAAAAFFAIAALWPGPGAPTRQTFRLRDVSDSVRRGAGGQGAGERKTDPFGHGWMEHSDENVFVDFARSVEARERTEANADHKTAAEPESADAPPASPPGGGGGSDIAGALRLAGEWPVTRPTRRRVLLDTDARAVDAAGWNAALAAARALRGRAELWVAASGGVPYGDVALTAFCVPPRVRQGGEGTVELTLRVDRERTIQWTVHDVTSAPGAMDGRGGLAENENENTNENAGLPLASGILRLPRGESVLRARVRWPEAGLRRLAARVAPVPETAATAAAANTPTDPVPENDVFYALTQARAPGRIFWIGRAAPDEASAEERFFAAMAGDGFRRLSPTALASLAADGSADGLSGEGPSPGDLLVLDNLPRRVFPPGAVRELSRALRAGTGLLALGGPDSLGPGGYGFLPPDASVAVGVGADTGGEDNDPAVLLPARMTPRSPLAVVFALDASGSMGAADEAGRSRLSLAAAAVRSAWEGLVEGDAAGLAVFRLQSETAVALRPVVAHGGGAAPRAAAPNDANVNVNANANTSKNVNANINAVMDMNANPGARGAAYASERLGLPPEAGAALAELRPGGGTRLWPAVEAAAAMLAEYEHPAARLALVVTDGEESLAVPPADSPERAARERAMAALSGARARLVVLRIAATPDASHTSHTSHASSPFPAIHAADRVDVSVAGRAVGAADAVDGAGVLGGEEWSEVFRDGEDLVEIHTPADRLRLPAALDAALRARRDYIRRDGAVAERAADMVAVLSESPDGGAGSLPRLRSYTAMGAEYSGRGAVAWLRAEDGSPLVAGGAYGLGRVAVTAGRPLSDWSWNDEGAALLRALARWCRGDGSGPVDGLWLEPRPEAGGWRITARSTPDAEAMDTESKANSRAGVDSDTSASPAPAAAAAADIEPSATSMRTWRADVLRVRWLPLGQARDADTSAPGGGVSVTPAGGEGGMSFNSIVPAESHALYPTDAGTWEGWIPDAPAPGGWRLAVVAQKPEASGWEAEALYFPWWRDGAGEWRVFGVNGSGLSALAQAAGGRLYTAGGDAADWRDWTTPPPPFEGDASWGGAWAALTGLFLFVAALWSRSRNRQGRV